MLLISKELNEQATEVNFEPEKFNNLIKFLTEIKKRVIASKDSDYIKET